MRTFFPLALLAFVAYACGQDAVPSSSSAVAVETSTYLQSTTAGTLIPMGVAVGKVQDAELAKSLQDVAAFDLGMPGWFAVTPKVGDTWPSAVSQYVEFDVEGAGPQYRIVLRWKESASGQILMKAEEKLSREQLRYGIHRFVQGVVREFHGENASTLSRIVFATGSAKQREIAQMDWDGFALDRLTSLGRLCGSPDMNPKRLVFSCMGPSGMELWSASPTGTGARVLLPGWQAYQPRLSPDGGQLAFSAMNTQGTDVYTYAWTGEPRKLVQHDAVETSASWGARGDLWFVSDRGGNPQIYATAASGGVERMTFEGRYNTSPALSPKGDKMAYVRMEGARLSIYVMDLRTRESRLVVSGGNNESPSWSPDGKMITFSSDRTGRSHIYIVREDGSGLTQITHTGVNTHPKWLP